MSGVEAKGTRTEAKAVKDFIASPHMQDAFERVNAMSTAPLHLIRRGVTLVARSYGALSAPYRADVDRKFFGSKADTLCQTVMSTK